MSSPPTTDLLLVEDNPHEAELALRALERHHLAERVRVARDGAEALSALFGEGAEGAARSARPAPPRLVLLDLKLPKVSGFEVLRRIREDDALRCLPVVVLSSSREESDVRECYRLGANGFVVKPVEFERFNDAIDRLGRYWLQLNQSPS